MCVEGNLTGVFDISVNSQERTNCTLRKFLSFPDEFIAIQVDINRMSKKKSIKDIF